LDSLIQPLKEILKTSSIESYEWGIPDGCPIEIPNYLVTSYQNNIHLKENLSTPLILDATLKIHYWIVRQWGAIGGFKSHDKNDARIRKFLDELKSGRLTKHTHECISSLSKIASFYDPENFAIYDSRAIYALNWLIFNNSPEPELFPQPTGRSSELSKYDMQTIFRLSKKKYTYKTHKMAFHDYCDLLKQLSPILFGGNSKPYKVEMLLFMVAPTRIIEDIESKVTIEINHSSQNFMRKVA